MRVVRDRAAAKGRARRAALDRPGAQGRAR